MTGLTSNPTIFDLAIKKSASYDAAIAEGLRKGKAGEALFFDVALDDLTRAADMFRAGPRSDQRRRWMGVAGSLSPAGV